MAVDKIKIANFGQYLGLRTDTPPSKCPPDFSPDCADMTFSVGGMATRNPFKILLTMPAETVWRKEFTCKDGSIQILALDVNGVLYTITNGVAIQIDTVTPGSMVNSVTAYGREYMAFYNASGGSDAPRQWDGKNLYRVSQGGPGAPPTITNLAIAASGISSGSRVGNEVTIVTATPHNLLRGYLATIGGVSPVLQSLTSIVINNGTLPGFATITTPMPHAFVPGNSIAIDNVQPIIVGGSITGWVRTDGVIIVTTATAHGLSSGDSILVELNTAGFGPTSVASVPSPTTFSYAGLGGNGSGTAGFVQLPWPLASGTLFTISAVPTSTTFQVPINFDNGTWTTGQIAFDWNGAFFVDNIISPTSFSYRQIGPTATAGASGTVTPTGQLPAGEHLVCQHFITKTGFLTAGSPSFRFTANGGQYVQVSDLAIGSANISGRALSFTGTNGSKFFMLLIPAQVNGLQVSTSTVINDNTTTSAVLDFSDISLLSSFGIDNPGNNLFQQVALNLPNGVDWYYNRLYWKGEKNTVIGLLNMDMAGGTLSGSTAPLGWAASGAGGIQQAGIMPAYIGTGTLRQGAATTQNGSVIIQPNLNYSIRAWGNGIIVATLSSGLTGFSSVANLNLTGSYATANFSLAMPAAIPSDLMISVSFVGATARDVQLIYADNPNRNPIDRVSYVQNPEAYDALTGNIGPADDNGELRAHFRLQESFHFLTESSLYSVQQIANAEPSSWEVVKVDTKCGAFQNAVVRGQGWAAWGGKNGGFWYAGGLPTKTTAIITPTWRNVAGISNIYDDNDTERVYFSTLDAQGNKSMLVYDYHEVNLGGSGKWSPWNRPCNWISSTQSGPVFTFGKVFYSLSATPGISDDNLGPISGYYTFAPVGSSMFQKDYKYLGLRITGVGQLTPFLYTKTLSALTQALNAQELSTLVDTVAEWDMNRKGRLLYMKLGQPGVQFELEDASIEYGNDPNSPVSGAR